MAVKIRLQRQGKKDAAFFHIVVADGRAPRDGRFIEKLGTYNPNTNPATIDINFDKAVTWLENGAQPTDTARAILSYRGILYKRHLNVGVRKGAMTIEQAEAKFEAWLAQKEGKISGKVDRLAGEKAKSLSARLAKESEVKDKKAAAIAAKLAPPVEEAPAEEVEATEAPAVEAEGDAPAAE
ncbi:MAG: 30S ribosomal protein S16 [Bacteroidia bacterium]|nr:30S ribosomal protein S16 [Bacteroidia bacterium]